MEISLSGDNPEEIAGIVNAVKKAYMDEVVNVDIKRRADRHDQLKKIKDDYGELLKERRENLRKLAETVGSDDRETLALRQQYAMEHLAHVQKGTPGCPVAETKGASPAQDADGPTETQAETSAPSVTEADINRWIDQDPVIAGLFDKLDQARRAIERGDRTFRKLARNAGADPVLQRLRDRRESDRGI